MVRGSGTLIASFPQSRSLSARIGLVVGFSLLTGLSAQVSIPLPFTPVPVTGQTFAVLLTGALLGSQAGAAAMVAYLLEGIAGLPVFAGGTAGIGKLLGPTGGYLIGCPIAAYVAGYLAERGWDRRLWSSVLAMLLGNAVIYVVGVPWLSLFLPAGQSALALGLYPFVPGDLYKVVLAAVLLPTGWAALRRFSGR